nr:MAG TPA: hypothetical protein [Caudoviricetes sp.]
MFRKLFKDYFLGLIISLIHQFCFQVHLCTLLSSYHPKETSVSYALLSII